MIDDERWAVSEPSRRRMFLLASAAVLGTVIVRAAYLGASPWFLTALVILFVAMIGLVVAGSSRPVAPLVAWVSAGAIFGLAVISAFTAGPALLLAAGLLVVAVAGRRRERR